MKNQKSIGNKGFSLVELIIVIAIMAILIGVMAPNLLRYVEKTNVSADTQLADAVKTAVQTAMMDPVVLNAADTSASAFLTGHATEASLSAACTGTFFNSVRDTLGSTAENAGKLVEELRKTLKSAHATDSDFMITVSGTNKVSVKITKTDASGNKKTDVVANAIEVK